MHSEEACIMVARQRRIFLGPIRIPFVKGLAPCGTATTNFNSNYHLYYSNIIHIL
jgi:hypothetical protein